MTNKIEWISFVKTGYEIDESSGTGSVSTNEDVGRFRNLFK